jgi:pimeloyl-ACP methyl ester carboxylesterase
MHNDVPIYAYDAYRSFWHVAPKVLLLPIVFFACTFANNANAAEKIIDFEGFPCHTTLLNHYGHLGVSFLGALTLNMDEPNCLNSEYYPPYSGTGVIRDSHTIDGNVEVHFSPSAGMVHTVSARVTGMNNVTMTAYNRTGGVLDKVQTGGTNYVGADSGIPNNKLLRVNSPSVSIRMVVFRDSGNTYTVDDLRFGSEVVEDEEEVLIISPTLTYSEDAVYGVQGEHPGVNRRRGVAGKDDFTFKVIYTGKQVHTPSVDLILSDANSGTATTYRMARDTSAAGTHGDGSYENGEMFTTTVTLPKGSYQYMFTATDSVESTTLSEDSSGLSHRIRAGYSNVLFLPGLQASRLYQGDNRLWEPNRHLDVEKLYMNAHVGSIYTDIYTKDIVDEAYGFSLNVYKRFIDFMDTEMVGNGVIQAWKASPYDWRMDLNALMSRGVERGGKIYYADGTTQAPYILETMDALMRSSDSGKVTIIGHSMGGLVAKVLIDTVRSPSHPYHHLYENIDQLIMVASPQLGTPAAIEGLLHGDRQQIGIRDLGLIVDEERARELGENMPSAYQLLPSKEYFRRVASPVLSFHDALFDGIKNIEELKHRAGTSISTHADLYTFLLGDDGVREEPAANNEEYPNVLNQQLLDNAVALHDRIDTRPLPPHIDLVQIAGWGQKTVRGIAYSCPLLTCAGSIDRLDRDILFTKEGDGTVVIPSAAASGGSTYYLDLDDYNSWWEFQRNRAHADMLETEPVQKLIQSIVQHTRGISLPEYMSLAKPIQTKADYELVLRSPVAIEVFDSRGRRTGGINTIEGTELPGYEARIPNSYYISAAGHTYVGFGSEDEHEVRLQGAGLGTFTLEVRKTLDDEVLEEQIFKDVPVVATMVGSMSMTGNEHFMLAVDIDGNGIIDTHISSDESALRIALKMLESVVTTHVPHRGIQTSLGAKVRSAMVHEAEGAMEGVVGDLQAFLDQVRAVRGKLLDSAVADTVQVVAEKIQAHHIPGTYEE